MTFGEKLSKLRKTKNYTQEQLAELLGVSRQSISKWESDAAYPETDKLIRICELFATTHDLTAQDVAAVRGLLDAYTPSYLRWASAVAKLLLNVGI